MSIYDNMPGGRKWADKNYKGGYEQYYKDKYGTSYKERDHSHKLDRTFEGFTRDAWNDYQMSQESMLGGLKQYADPGYVAEAAERAAGYADSANRTARGATMRTLDRADAGEGGADRSAMKHQLGLQATLNKVDSVNNARGAAIELRDAARDGLAQYRQSLMGVGGAGLEGLMSARSARRGQGAANQAGALGSVADGIGTIAAGFMDKDE